jgi:hypothetical protein
MEARGGTKYLFQNLILPALRESYEDFSRAVQNADLLITHSLASAAVLVAQKQKLPWISGVVSPIFFYSRHDPPLMPLLPQLAQLPLVGSLWTQFLMTVIARRFEPIFAPLYEFRQELGFSRARWLRPNPTGHPIRLSQAFALYRNNAAFRLPRNSFCRMAPRLWFLLLALRPHTTPATFGSKAHKRPRC